MSTYPDLSPYTYDAAPPGEAVNVGWLGGDAGFPTGEVDSRVVAALLRRAVDPQNVMRGYHYCAFCDAESPICSMTPEGEEAALGTGEIHVPDGEGRVYVAPTLIVHYIDTHHYRPPDVFLHAVLRDPG
ncbi:hypothetical protein [Actinomadura flavalba]|uniref:DUF7919 family protein n=1 Tax=Actinomadura flavalba TaxID=1120938 RepID=UPI0003628FDB|nr:hypothetical protein [Actinomadura flavalba]